MDTNCCSTKTFELSVSTEHDLWIEAPIKAIVNFSCKHLREILQARKIIDKSDTTFNGLTLVWFGADITYFDNEGEECSSEGGHIRVDKYGVSFRSYLHGCNVSFETSEITFEDILGGNDDV